MTIIVIIARLCKGSPVTGKLQTFGHFGGFLQSVADSRQDANGKKKGTGLKCGRASHPARVTTKQKTAASTNPVCT
jgi:hypothetical protein